MLYQILLNVYYCTMHHENPETRRFDIVDTFANVQTDPLLRNVFDKIRTYNELLVDQYVSGEQITEIMKEIDDEWRQLMGETVIVSGNVMFANDMVAGISEQKTSSDFYEDHEMEFGGVLPILLESMPSSGDYKDDKLHQFRLELRLIREGLTPEGKRILMRGSAKLDEIASIDFPNMMSVERAYRWLDFYKTDELQEIEADLLNPSSEECEMVMKLAGLTIDGRLPHDVGDGHALSTAQALNIYLESLFSFDKDSPYELSVNGEAWSIERNGDLIASAISGTSIAAVDRIVWLAKCNELSYLLSPHIAVRFLGTTKDDAVNLMYVPLDSVDQFRSQRHSYFVGYPTEIKD